MAINHDVPQLLYTSCYFIFESSLFTAVDPYIRAIKFNPWMPASSQDCPNACRRSGARILPRWGQGL